LIKEKESREVKREEERRGGKRKEKEKKLEYVMNFIFVNERRHG
jgi:hypothetical protein